ncbi:MAG: asparaginase domain-containing protein [Bauldia sp.]
MRASTALGADGPANIHHAVLAAGDRRLRDCGVLVAMNGLLLPGWQAVKTNSVALDSFRAYPAGSVGRVLGERLMVVNTVRPAPLAGAFQRRLASADDLPEVGVVYLHGGCGDAPLRVWQGTQCRGLVIAAFGAGTMPGPMAETAREMAAEGRVIVVSSRVGEVTVQPETMSLQGGAGLLASGFLNPAKSAILLSLALADGLSAPDIKLLLDRIRGGANGLG